MDYKCLRENKLLILFFLLLLAINIYIFYHLFMVKDSDLMVKDVSYSEEKGWKVTVCSTVKHPGQRAEVDVVFHDGNVNRLLWPLSFREKTWYFKDAGSPVGIVEIRASRKLDWDPENSTYNNSLWSKHVKLLSLPTNSDFSYVVGKGGQIYIVYSLHDKSKMEYKIFLENRKPSGEKVLKPAFIAEGRGRVISSLLFQCVGTSGKEEYAVIGWNALLENGQEYHLYGVALKQEDTQGNGVDLQRLQLIQPADGYPEKAGTGSQIRLLDLYRPSGEQVDGEIHWYILTGAFQNGRTFLELYKFFNFEQVDGLIISELDTALDRIKTARIIPDESGLNLFWVSEAEWSYQLNFLKIDYAGRIIIPKREVARLKIDFSFPGALQIVRVEEQGFHTAWMETTGRFRVQQINYLIMDKRGKIINRYPGFIKTGGYCPGFALSITPVGNIEFFYPVDHRHLIYQNQKNTEIYHRIFKPDLEPVHPGKLVVSSTYYDNYPSLQYTDEGYRYLFWVRDKKDSYDLMYSTTNPRIKKQLDRFSLTDLKALLINESVGFIYYTVLGMVFTALASVLPLVVLLIYNRLGKYKKNNFLYWLSGILFMFLIKIYLETVYLTWTSPLLSRIYNLNLIFLALVIIALSVYWKIADSKEREYRSIFINKLIACWFALDFFVVYFVHIRGLYF